MTYIEEVKDKPYRGVTIVGKNAVYYAVEKREGEEWITVWDKGVSFGHDKAHRAGGYAFRYAAEEQERQLLNLSGVD